MVITSRLNKLKEVPELYPRLLQDMGESRALHGAMGGNGELQQLVRQVFLHSNMAPLLPDYDPTIAPKGCDDSLIAELWDTAHKTSSTSSTATPSARALSSSTGSRYSSIASRMLAKDSSCVSPSLIQQGSDGARTVKPPSGLDPRRTRIFMAISSKDMYGSIRYGSINRTGN